MVILHNPRCSTSRGAVAAAHAAGAKATIRNYLTDPLSEPQWLAVLAMLAGEPGDLVRRDDNFRQAGLSDGDVATAEQVAAVLASNPVLAQRPVLIKAGRAIVGRPKSRIAPFLAAHDG